MTEKPPINWISFATIVFIVSGHGCVCISGNARNENKLININRFRYASIYRSLYKVHYKQAFKNHGGSPYFCIDLIVLSNIACREAQSNHREHTEE